MKVSELVGWIDRWFDPTFTEVEAAAAFGAARDAAAIIAEVAPLDPRFKAVTFERMSDPPRFLSGLQLALAKPEAIRWDQVIDRWGEPRFLGPPKDFWGGPKGHAFRVEGKSFQGTFILAFRGPAAATVDIESVIIRRYPNAGG
jgi:hypothetical protein